MDVPVVFHRSRKVLIKVPACCFRHDIRVFSDQNLKLILAIDI
jgi:hypothetical protein